MEVPESANVKVSLFQMTGPSNKQVLFMLVGCFCLFVLVWIFLAFDVKVLFIPIIDSYA